jgi:hypothetical protein
VYGTVTGTVVSTNKDKFSFVIDPGQISENPDDHADGVNIAAIRFRRNKPISKISRFLEEADRTFCALGKLMRDGVCERPTGESCSCAEIEDFERVTPTNDQDNGGGDV